MIQSSTNKKLKLIHSLLSSRKNRDKEALFVLESPKAIRSLPPESIEFLLVGAGNAAPKENVDVLPRGSGYSCYEVSEELFKTLVDTHTSQGVIAVVKKATSRDLAFLGNISSGTVVVLDGIQNPGNVGTIIRSAAAFDCAAVFYTEGTSDPFSPKAVRSTAGAILELPVLPLSKREAEPLSSCSIDNLKKMKFTIAITVGNENTSPLPVQDIQDWKPRGKVGVVFSNEGAGVSHEFLAAADQSITIAHHPRVESLNVAVSAGIVLEVLYRRTGE